MENLNWIDRRKKRVVTTLFLYLSLFFLGCDFKSPEKWETPTWYIPLTFPLIDKDYSFAGLVDSVILFADSTSNVIQVVFEDSLVPNGIPDSIFNINMQNSEMDIPEFGMGGGEPIELPPIPGDIIEIPIPLPIDLNALDCFPVNFLDSLDEIPEEQDTIAIEFELDNDLVEVKKVIVIDGIWNMTVSNDLPFTISSVEFSIGNGGEVLYSTPLLIDIEPYTTKSDPQDITVYNPTTIDLTDDLVYTALITIDSEQSGEEGVDCPDIDNPPVYICYEDVTAGIYQFDDTCEEICAAADCTLLYYCEGNLEDTYPSADCILPDESSETPLAFICGTDVADIYLTDICASECSESDCNQLFYCLDDISGQNLTYINSDCSTGTDDSFVCVNECLAGSSVSCTGDCSPGGFVGGWEINQAVDPALNLSFEYSFDVIGSVVVDLLGIDTTILTGQSFPGFDGIAIKQAKINVTSVDYPNQLAMDISNDLFADFILQFDFINFFDEESGNYLSSPITVPAYGAVDTVIDFSGYILAYGLPSEQVIDSMVFSVNATIPSGEYSIEVIDNKIEIGSPVFNEIQMSNMSLEYIAAITDSLGFPTADSPPIEDIPQGFTGFEFYDIIMEIELFNEIGIPVDLDLELSGTKTGGDSIPPILINTVINSPYYLQEDYDCDYAVTGDTARTLIRLNKDRQITYYYCKTDEEPVDSVFTDLTSGDQSSIVDLMNFAPEKIFVGGGVQIDGEGILAPESEVWGTFTLIAPLAFIFEKDITIIPADYTEMAPMDTATANMIDSSLIEASINIEIENASPLGGSLALLVSDSTIFPLFLDSLVTGTWDANVQYQQENYGYIINTDIWDTLMPPLLVDSVKYTILDSTDLENRRALEVQFYKDSSLVYFIGRMFAMGFPASDSIDPGTGFFIDTAYAIFDTSSLIIDTTRMGWITTDQPRFNVPMITFDSSEGDPRTFQTTNYIGVTAYLTFILNTDGLFRTESDGITEPVITVIK